MRCRMNELGVNQSWGRVDWRLAAAAGWRRAEGGSAARMVDGGGAAAIDPQQRQSMTDGGGAAAIAPQRRPSAERVEHGRPRRDDLMRCAHACAARMQALA